MKDGKAVGISYIDSRSRDIKEVRAKVMVLCASTLESTRLLMNSGICGDNDALGKNPMDHIYQGGALFVTAGAAWVSSGCASPLRLHC